MRAQAAVVLWLLALGLGASQEPGGQQPTPESVVNPKGPMWVSGVVMAQRIVKKVAPVYPGDVQASGTVVLHAVIGKDGSVENLTVISGPGMLQGAAIDAVKQWVFEPFLLNGEPIEVDTPISVVFQSGEANAAPAQPLQRVKVSSALMQSQRLTYVAPVSPAAARSMHLTGSVVLATMIGKDGKVERAVPMSGPEVLRGAAVDAVKQWTYRPFVQNGQSVEVETAVMVTFN